MIYGSGDRWKNKVETSDIERMWDALSKGKRRLTIDNLGDYFQTFDKLMKNKRDVSVDDMRIPINYYIKGSGVAFARASKYLNTLKQALQEALPHLFEGGELKPEFSGITAKLAGISIGLDTDCAYLYEVFKAIDGVLHLTLLV
mgnify:CR=1 FL=1